MRSSSTNFRSKTMFVPPQDSTNNLQYRINTFYDAMEGIDGMELARIGYFYKQSERAIQCFSCGKKHSFYPWENHNSSIFSHFDFCEHINSLTTQQTDNSYENVRVHQREGEEPITTFQSQSLTTPAYTAVCRQNQQGSLINENFQSPTVNESLFPCNDPAYPEMRCLRDRLVTFSSGSRTFSTRCSVTDIANAGLFYKGWSDATVCWCCGIGLKDWNYDDDPWHEHAKWQPNCEYVLQQKGIEYVEEVLRQNPQPRRQVRMPNRRRRQYLTNHGSTAITSLSITSSRDFVGVQIFPEPNWVHRDVSVPNFGMQSTYRARGIEITTGSSQQNAHLRTIRMNTISNRSDTSSNDRTASLMTTEALNMGFSEDEIQQAIRSKARGTGHSYSSTEELIEDLTSQQEKRQTAIACTSTSTLTSPTSSQLFQNASSPDILYPIQSEEPSTPRTPSGSTLDRCHVCGGRSCETVFLPCGHYVTCQLCSSWLSSCPSCQATISEKIQVRKT